MALFLSAADIFFLFFRRSTVLKAYILTYSKTDNYIKMSLVTKAFSDLRRIKKEATKVADAFSHGDEEKRKELFDIWMKKGVKNAANEINQVCDLLEDPDYGGAMLRLLTIVKEGERTALPCKQTYMITIRPDDSKAYFPDFKEKVEDFVTRKCFLSYKYSFEQKGTKPEDMGKGFHVHIVANMKQRSKSEVLRDTLSSWKDWINEGLITANNVHVCITKDGEKLVQNYLIEYESDDGHKAVTKDYDHQWREAVGLYNLYVSE